MSAAAMHHVRFLERGSLDANVRRPAFPHTWQEHGKVAVDEIVPCLTGATIAIVNKTPLSAETLAQLPSLAMIAVAATGTDNIDIACCRERGIVVSNIRNYAVHTVPEHAFALILALRREVLTVPLLLVLALVGAIVGNPLPVTQSAPAVSSASVCALFIGHCASIAQCYL